MKLKGFVIGFVAMVLATLPGNALAIKLIDEELLYYYGQNGIYHYNGSAERCGPSDGGNQNYAGVPVWSDAELEAISDNQAIYEEAASAYDIPWQILAVIHSMETNLQRYNPANGQGVYQLYSYTGGGNNANSFAPAAEISEEEFREQTMMAAEIISNSAGDLTDADAVKRLFFSYNGMASEYIEKALLMGYSLEEAENGEGSPYVMNRYDSDRDSTAAEMNENLAGRFVADGEYDSSSVSSEFGAFVKYQALAGNIYCSDNGGGIVETALLLSWEGTGHSKDDPKPEYVDAMREVGTYFEPCQSGGNCAPIGASCDIFVSTVMRYSGSDPDFPATGPAVQEEYMASRSDMYMQVLATDVSDLEPGDILVTTENGRHIYLYLGDGMQASASYDDRTGEHFEGVYLEDNGTGAGSRHYSVYRRIQ